MSDFHIELMTLEELKIAVDWARMEGWNPGLNDAECFYRTDPHGFFVGKLKGQMIAVGSAVIYDEHFAFCGFYIVDKKYRGQGYGMELTQARLKYITNRNAGIDGVLTMVDNYARIGYRYAHNNARYVLTNPPFTQTSNPAIVDLKTIPFEQLASYDRRYFPAPRPIFLSAWIKQKTARALGYVQDKNLKGYGVIRKCYEGYKIGPLFADDPMIAEKLFQQLLQYTKAENVYLDIPENNSFAVELVNKYNMSKVFSTARMYLKGQPELSIKGIYGITSFELG